MQVLKFAKKKEKKITTSLNIGITKQYFTWKMSTSSTSTFALIEVQNYASLGLISYVKNQDFTKNAKMGNLWSFCKDHNSFKYQSILIKFDIQMQNMMICNFFSYKSIKMSIVFEIIANLCDFFAFCSFSGAITL